MKLSVVLDQFQCLSQFLPDTFNSWFSRNWWKYDILKIDNRNHVRNCQNGTVQEFSEYDSPGIVRMEQSRVEMWNDTFVFEMA